MNAGGMDDSRRCVDLDLATAFGAALILGFIAARLRLPALVGYLLAGVLIGPFTPGFVADTPLAAELAEIGVMLLMFGVGLHFSLDRPARRPQGRAARRGSADRGCHRAGAHGRASGGDGPWGAALVFGLALSVRQHRRCCCVRWKRAAQLDSMNGRIAVRLAGGRRPRDGAGAVLLPPMAGALGGTVRPEPTANMWARARADRC
jgi:CPA2 family monovalent cation:H+ antiporter-2